MAGSLATSLADGRVADTNPELNAVILNLGKSQGVKEGMPFGIYQDDVKVATVKIVLPESADRELDDLMHKWRERRPYDPRRVTDFALTNWTDLYTQARVAELQARYRSVASDLAASESRLHTIEELEATLEGHVPGTRAVVEAAARGDLTGLHGVVSNLIEVYISRLRRKLCAGGEPNLIETVRGIGYRFGTEVLVD